MELQCKNLKIEWRMLRIRDTSKSQFHKQVVGRGFGRISEGFGLGFIVISPSTLLLLRVWKSIKTQFDFLYQDMSHKVDYNKWFTINGNKFAKICGD